MVIIGKILMILKYTFFCQTSNVLGLDLRTDFRESCCILHKTIDGQENKVDKIAGFIACYNTQD